MVFVALLVPQNQSQFYSVPHFKEGHTIYQVIQA